jgi:hypothetical protein
MSWVRNSWKRQRKLRMDSIRPPSATSVFANALYPQDSYEGNWPTESSAMFCNDHSPYTDDILTFKQMTSEPHMIHTHDPNNIYYIFI